MAMTIGRVDQESVERRPPAEAFARSLLAERSLPGRRMLCSRELGWQTMLARTYLDPSRTDRFATAQSCDLLVVLVVSGTYTIESRHGRRWSQANYHPGSVGVTAPGNVSVLRWAAAPGQRLESLHLHLGADLLEETSAGLALTRSEPLKPARVHPPPGTPTDLRISAHSYIYWR